MIDSSINVYSQQQNSNSWLISTTPFVSTTTTVGSWNVFNKNHHCISCLKYVDLSKSDTLYAQCFWHCSTDCFYQFLLKSLESLDSVPRDNNE